MSDRTTEAVMEIGIGFSSEELGAREIVDACVHAEDAGITRAWVSDHFHPWIDAQGESPFVWTVLGAVAHATERLRVGTGVTCPTVRIHPAIVAQAGATTQAMFEGRFWLGVGSGEALNEHITGAKWPEASVRLEMLCEAVDIIRELWGGAQTSCYGKYFTVENARLYTLPDNPPPIYVSGFGPKSVAVAARIGDGFVSTRPDDSLIKEFDSQGGRGPKLSQLKVAWAPSRAEGEDLVFERWPTSGLSGELSQELPTPAHFEQAVAPVRKEDVVSSTPCGADAADHIAAIRKYEEAGYDELYVTQVGTRQREFLDFYAREVLPELTHAQA
jgi:G6PDH family F420-dependent oxidoreductase